MPRISGNEDGEIWIEWPLCLLCIEPGGAGYSIRNNVNDGWSPGSFDTVTNAEAAAREIAEFAAMEPAVADEPTPSRSPHR